MQPSMSKFTDKFYPETHNPPDGYIFTGEYRIPVIGDIFLGYAGYTCFYSSETYELASQHSNDRHILKPLNECACGQVLNPLSKSKVCRDCDEGIMLLSMREL